MPINIPKGLPAQQILQAENIFALDYTRAQKQDIRPLKFLILNLMPKKIETETQLLRLLSKTPLQIDVDFLKVSTHASKNTSEEHLLKFYDVFDNIKDNYYDGMIITGAPVEHLPFNEVTYYEELKQILQWKDTHVFSTMHICWGAQIGLYEKFGIHKVDCSQKIFGIDTQQLYTHNFLTSGFDERFCIPQSRHTAFDEKAIKGCDALEIVSGSTVGGSTILCTKELRNIYVSGHFEYTRRTLEEEYLRDIAQNKEIEKPFNYYEEDGSIVWKWKSHANLLYRNWVHYIYQMTPYKIEEIANL